MIFSSCATAQGSESGVNALCPDYAGTQYEQAINALCKKANAGDKAAQVEVGLAALHRLHVQGEPLKAAAWFEKAARQDDADAMCLLGTQYASGTGVAHDEVRGRQWFVRAAEKGHPLAQARLSECYALGIGGKRDDAAAEKWVAKAQASGNFYAKRTLSPKDMILLEDPMVRAEAGDPVAQYYAAQYNRDNRYRADYDRMEKWYSKSAGQGYAPAQVKLGILYTQDAPGKKDLKKAAALFSAAAAQGDAEGQYELALLHLQGQVEKPDLAEAEGLLRQSVAKGYDKACSLMGMLYVRGIGVNENREKERGR
ncbi:MAG: sel1 repeat family protein [Oxalobacter sp.]|nr:sel1 repeat family protein [Oxalobacter sp.]